jgi:hypothetical protein
VRFVYLYVKIVSGNAKAKVGCTYVLLPITGK